MAAHPCTLFTRCFCYLLLLQKHSTLKWQPSVFVLCFLCFRRPVRAQWDGLLYSMLYRIWLGDWRQGLESSGRAVEIRPGSSHLLLSGDVFEDVCRTTIHNLVTSSKMNVPKEAKAGGSISALYVHCVGHTGQFCPIFLLKASGKLYSLWSYFLCVCFCVCVYAYADQKSTSRSWFSLLCGSLGSTSGLRDGSMCSYPISISGLEKEHSAPKPWVLRMALVGWQVDMPTVFGCSLSDYGV